MSGSRDTSTYTLLSDREPVQWHLDVLFNDFGHKEFKPDQWRIIRSILDKKHDSVCVMATGYGKSLCYQFPPIINESISIVISPSISLMEDQVNSLKVPNVSACFLDSAQNNERVINDLLNGVYDLVYLTPEFATSECGLSLLTNMVNSRNIGLFAIDEAHCIFQWGGDFRPAYKDLGKISDLLIPNVPILALCSTATDTARKDIIKCLKMRDPQILCSSLNRPNLYFKGVKKSADLWADLSRVFESEKDNFNIENGSVIIYCITMEETDAIVELLASHKIKCGGYHADMDMDSRKLVQKQFKKDKIKIIVATIDFGMGIDKSNVRCVIHYGASSDMGIYYRQVGIAGRDGLPSLCILYHSPRRGSATHSFPRERPCHQDEIKSKEEAFEVMEQYFSTTECRRHFMLSYFEQKQTSSNIPKSNCCDNCSTRLDSTYNCDV